MARRHSWSDVRGGAIAAILLTIIVFATLKYAPLGRLRGDTFVLHAVLSEARGLLKGSEVWLAGKKVGKVTDIEFLPLSLDSASRLMVSMQVLEEYRPVIRRDAVAQVRAGGSLVGSPVVYLTAGAISAAMVQSGDTIHAKPQSDFEAAAGEFSLASKEFPAIISNIKTLSGQMSGTEGTAGAFLNQPGGPGLPALARTTAQMGRLVRSLEGNGSAGLILRGGLMDRVGRVMARADSVRALVASPNTSLGRLRKDSTLLAEVADIRNEMTLIRAQLDEPRGTAGRLMQDSALTNAIAEAQRQMGLLFADIKKRPFRYIVF